LVIPIRCDGGCDREENERRYRKAAVDETLHRHDQVLFS